ncbi:21 kDa seed protein-like [Andrographis paniculata]|uniref:21 kDa seed protein-like n=1 Tax=Andrographis paniculata TaxID=175694 RepID=UPI0021E8C30B|nr:21 kDa seed protein-like [Andrographis paniculata]
MAAMAKPLFSTNILSLSHLLILVVISFSGHVAAQEFPLDGVRDTRNSFVRAGQSYYIYSAYNRYPVIFTAVGPEPCPIYVAINTAGRAAFPVRFFSVNGRETFIRLNVSVTIEFTWTFPCFNSTVWQVAPNNHKGDEQQLITLGGTQGKPGCNNIRSYFKIEWAPGDVYRISYDPDDVCDIPVQSYSVGPGTVYANGAQPLALVDAAPMLSELEDNPKNGMLHTVAKDFLYG